MWPIHQIIPSRSPVGSRHILCGRTFKHCGTATVALCIKSYGAPEGPCGPCPNHRRRFCFSRLISHLSSSMHELERAPPRRQESSLIIADPSLLPISEINNALLCGQIRNPRTSSFASVSKELQRSAKRRGCLLSYNQAEPGRELTQPSPRLFAEPCTCFIS